MKAVFWISLILAVILGVSCVSNPGIKSFGGKLDNNLSSTDNSISFVYLTEMGDTENNQLLIDYITGEIQPFSSARFFDRTQMDRLLEERRFVHSGFLDNEKVKFLRDFWPSRYIMTGVYQYSQGTLDLKLKVIDVISSEMVFSELVRINVPVSLWNSLDKEAAARAKLSEKMELRRKAMETYGSGDYYAAIPLLQQYQNKYAGDFGILGALSYAFQHIGDRKSAVEVGLEYLKVNPRAFDSLATLGKAYSWYHPEKAIEYLEMAVALNESDYWTIWSLATQYVTLGYNKKAEATFRKAIEKASAVGDLTAVSQYKDDLLKIGVQY